ncbi:uncharacterized protein VDAG_10065 [Verticillium dahliae VdLs.17]|uniref:DNA-binding protein RAP1 n=1 Tax=Verticillium dahliae (strain VdLs.17 / ATCC MYA-4575 / FGSC 10137) TaxID=498257 RepID=G2XIU2_VERDV|nr:uncharacterized protein VDAG_10065 [Verticillium dahliae VdLs.17]EGY20436.1 hypothetical protein VDAG_10065 [Verticillium dahliae VdLs.17]
MSAAITYEGLPGGQLFKGIKFWVAQRVACRKSLLESISNNRHTYQSWRDRWVKKLSFLSQEELQKRIISNTPAQLPEQRDAPAQPQPSESPIQQPKLQNLESAAQLKELASYWPQGQWWHSDYPLEEPVQQRTIDSMLRVTKYVLEADDRLDDLWKEDGILSRLARTKGAGLLTRAVADAARQEIKSHYRNQLERADGSPAEPLELPESPADAQMASPLVSRLRDQSPRNSLPKLSKNEAPQSTQRSRFTPEHDILIAKSVKRAARQGIQAGPKWFQDFAVENPEHTWQSWRNHWLKVLRPRIEAAESKGQKYDFYHEYSKPPFQNQSSSPQENGPSNYKHRGVRQTTTSPDRVEDVIEVKDAQTEPPSPELDDERNEFLANIAAYSEVMELAIDLQPKICRQSVDLYLLHVAVEACRDPDGEEDWQQVAEQLGFARGQYPNAAKLLRKCYENSLRDFVNTLEEPDSQSTAEEGIKDPADGNGTGNGAIVSGASDPEISPENTKEQWHWQEISHHNTDSTADLSAASGRGSLGVKRDRTTDMVNDASVHGSSAHKRQRRSRDDEIPSTPDNISKASKVDGNNLTTRSRSNSVIRGRAAKDQVRDSQDTGDDEITPSQQLHQEAKDDSPIPLNLPVKDSARKRQHKSRPETKGAGEHDFTIGTINQGVNRIHEWSASVAEAHERNNEVRPALETDQDADEVARKVEYYESFGYSRKIVCRALTATCMETGIASEVMEMLKTHPNQGLPTNMMGVWTSKDDEGLRFICGEPSSDPKIERDRAHNVGRERRRLEHKHGRNRIATRVDFLAIARHEARRKRMETLPIP